MTGPRSIGECYQALALAEDLPFGRSRTGLVEEVVAEADQLGDLALAVEARLDLMSAYTYGGEPLKRPGVFAWLLARHDERAFEGSHLYRLLWQYKWMTIGATTHPAISLDTVMATLEDMERRYRDAGEPLAPVLGCRYTVLAHVRGAAAALAEYQAWTRAPRTRLSDCRACEPTDRVRHLAAVGRHEDAVAEALPVLSGQDVCAEQPAAMVAEALESLLLTGRGARAATEHLRGVRQSRLDPSGTDLWARHVSVLTRAGRLQRATDLLAERLHELDQPPTPHAGMRLAAAAAGLCARLVANGWGDQPLAAHRPSSLVAAPTPVRDLLDPLREYALTTAAAFDARNGSGVVGTSVQALLDPSPLPELPLDLLPDATVAERPGRRAARVVPGDAAAPASATVGRRAARTAAGPDAASAEGLAGLAAQLEAARQTGERGLRELALRVWREQRETLLDADPCPIGSPPWDPDDADRQRALDVARLDCAAALDDLEHDPSLLHATRALGARLHDAGDEAGAYRFELWWLREAVTAGLVTPDDAMRAADDVVAEMRAGVSPADQGTAYLALLALLHVVTERTGPAPATQARRGRVLQSGLAAMAATDADQLDGYQRGCYALLLRLDAAAQPAPARADALLRALTLLPPGVRRGERALVAADLAALHADDGDPGFALGLLAEAEPDALAAGDPGLAAYAASMACRLLSAQGEDVEAVDAAQRAVRHAELGTDPLTLDQARQSLVHTLRDAGRVLEAAEIAELAMREAEQRLAAAGVEPDAPGEDLDAAPGAAVGPPGLPRPDVHLAGTLAWAAAVCAAELGEQATAHRHARRSADWHTRNGSATAAGEAWQVAARTAATSQESARCYAAAVDAFDAGGMPWQAAACRRARAFPLADAEGVHVALAALDEAHLAVDRMPPIGDLEPSAQQRRADWEHVALTEQAARVLAQGGALAEALDLVGDLPRRYRALGDLPSVWDVAVLRAGLLEALDRPAEAVAPLTEALEEAADEQDAARVLDLAETLADLHERLGDPEAARTVRARFGAGTGRQDAAP